MTNEEAKNLPEGCLVEFGDKVVYVDRTEIMLGGTHVLLVEAVPGSDRVKEYWVGADQISFPR